MQVKQLFAIGIGALTLLTLGFLFERPVLAAVRAALVRNVDNPDLAPYAASLTANCNSAAILVYCDATVQVPAGQRLIIDHIDTQMLGQWTGEIQITSTTVTQHAPLQYTGSILTGTLGALSTHLAAEAGTTVTAEIDLAGDITPEANPVISLTGHLVTP